MPEVLQVLRGPEGSCGEVVGLEPRYRVIVYCSGCGFKLYEDSGSTVKFAGPVSATRVYELHGGVCPVCGRRLSRKPLDVKFTSLEEYAGDRGWFVDGKA
jgi:hypothetical protein